MGKASRWFRSLFSSKSKSKFIKNGQPNPNSTPYPDANKHAIAVAAATAAVAEAALAAAQAAAEVVKLTSGGGGGSWRSSTASYRGGDRRLGFAAVKIQSAFRAYLARRALRALKALVKLQARVRGYIVRKQSADMLRRMQAMARIQARASAHRYYATPESSNIDNNDTSNFHHKGMTNTRRCEEMLSSAKHGGSLHKQMRSSHSRPHLGNTGKESSELATNWLNHWMEQCKLNNVHDSSAEAGPGDDGRSDKILEIDTWKPHQTARRNDRSRTSRSTSQYFSAWNETGHDYSNTSHLSRLSSKHQNPNPSISSEEVQSLISPNFPPEVDQTPPWTAVISPGGRSSSSRPASNLRGPFTPSRSECSRSGYSDYIGHPSYMANTESSWAKVRSQSAPKQRMQLEEPGLNSKYGRGLGEPDANSEKGSTYQYTGHLKRQWTPTRGAMYRYRL